MFLKILKKDLQRKKTMNLVLLVLVILASTLVASGTNLLYTTSTAISSFIDKSNIADLIVTTADDQQTNSSVSAWAEGQQNIKAVYSQPLINVQARQIGLPEGRKGISTNVGLLLSTVPDEINLVFGENNGSLTLKPGEIALPVSLKNATGLEAGEVMEFRLAGVTRTFKVAAFFKDAYLGSDLLTIKRMMISGEDFAAIRSGVAAETLSKLWSFVATSGTPGGTLSAELAKAGIQVTFEIDKSLVSASFMIDRIIAALIVAISLFLICIAFLTLRFTIVSTLQDEYRSIGIMKAIGFRNYSIKQLYLIKYLALSAVGGAVGLMLSLPLTRALSRSISQYIIVPESFAGDVVAAGSVIVTVVVILLFCLQCMRAIGRASAIDAIRLGHTGERFGKMRIVRLHRSRLLPPTVVLALSDVLGKLRSYTTLIITVVLSTAVMIIPINLIHTISEPSFIEYFGTAPADFYTKSEIADVTLSEVHAEMDRISQVFKEHDYAVSMSVDYTFVTKYISDDGEDSRNIGGIKSEPAAQHAYLDGVSPKLDNEIAITSIMSENYHKQPGDSIMFEIDGQKRTFLITGIFQTISNEGYMVRVSEQFVPKMVNSYQFGGSIDVPDKQKPEIVAKMKAELPELEIKSAEDMLSVVLGGFMGQLQSVKVMLIGIVCLIVFFIASLFVRLLIAKEVRGIAVMKSLGFTGGQIRQWQMLRILLLMLGSLVVGVLAANLLGERLFGVIFRMFGLTHIEFVISPLEVYLLYPALLLAVVVLAVYTSCGQIKRVQVWNMNME
ncbi:ABC transporter permease ['Paenibacillus yunnanensis' Narsing Rao et al. 2020]|uniref:ABC transporter permease n=1 Tax=Paenibacillus tengchongensis TaxID=2608684 RepID=UPI00124F2C48|nr:ABC transporter permease [Paenibacillus tengchongensis]